MPAEPWVRRQQFTRWMESASAQYSTESLPTDTPTIDYFGDHVAFDKALYHDSKGG